MLLAFILEKYNIPASFLFFFNLSMQPNSVRYVGSQPCNISRQKGIEGKIADLMFYTVAFYYVGVMGSSLHSQGVPFSH